MISIITPVYNVERFLPCMIESVLAQSEQDWELLLIDDQETLLLHDGLLKGLDDELDAFLKELLEN